jgi:hypothetical protein
MKIATFAAVLMLSTAAVPFAAAASEAQALKDASAIQTAESKESGRAAYSPGHALTSSPATMSLLKARWRSISPIVTPA